jgi:hypothetical protein
MLRAARKKGETRWQNTRNRLRALLDALSVSLLRRCTMTRLEKKYYQLLRKRLLAPAAQPVTDFKDPSSLVPVPTFTTYGVGDTRGLNEEQIAELERHSK